MNYCTFLIHIRIRCIETIHVYLSLEFLSPNHTNELERRKTLLEGYFGESFVKKIFKTTISMIRNPSNSNK